VTPHRVWGAGEETLLLHCSLAHSGAWSALAALLPGRLVAPDQPGHGRRGPPKGDLHDQTLAETIALAPERFDLIGHSFGATVALRLALAHPERVQSLTLIEPPLFAAARAAGDPAFALYHARQRAFAAAVHEGRLAAALAGFHADWGDGQSLDTLPERVVTYMRDRIALVAAQDEILLEDRAGLLAPGGLEGLTMPIHLIGGAQSPPIADAILRALAARMPKARKSTIAGAGHMLPITHPEALAALLQG
jgi:pimeloyl-ACP methyl ester carboxylesterase